MLGIGARGLKATQIPSFSGLILLVNWDSNSWFSCNTHMQLISLDISLERYFHLVIWIELVQVCKGRDLSTPYLEYYWLVICQYQWLHKTIAFSIIRESDQLGEVNGTLIANPTFSVELLVDMPENGIGLKYCPGETVCKNLEYSVIEKSTTLLEDLM